MREGGEAARKAMEVLMESKGLAIRAFDQEATYCQVCGCGAVAKFLISLKGEDGPEFLEACCEMHTLERAVVRPPSLMPGNGRERAPELKQAVGA